MRPNLFKTTLAIFAKELKSEFRNKSAFASVIIFSLAAVFTLAATAMNQKIQDPLFAALLWIILFFVAMTGLNRTFLIEEDRATSLFLKTLSHPTPIYLGKLIYNLLTNIITGIITTTFFLLFYNDFTIENPVLFSLILIIGNISISATTTILSAIVAKAGMKSGILPVLAFPILLPILIATVNATTHTIIGSSYTVISQDVQSIIAFTGTIITISILLFSKIWED
jgi:heme exporter protein B